MSTSAGVPTNALYGFLTMVRKILAAENPDYVVICFDRKEKTFRHEKYKEYKAQRKPMPDELAEQIPYIKEVVKAHNIPQLEMVGYEADDLLGTLANRFAEKDVDAYIVTSDKDALQLVTDKIKTYTTYRDTITVYDIEKVKERYGGLGPESVVDIMGLMGDSSDNIPGVPGVGEKTAISYIKDFGSIENLIAQAGTLKTEKQRQRILENTEIALLSRELATIECNVPIDFDLTSYEAQAPDSAVLHQLFQKFELRSFLRETERPPQTPETDRLYHAVDTIEELQKLVNKLSTVEAFSFDTETTSASPTAAQLVGMSFSCKAKEAYYVVLSHAGIET
ncbi:MAG: DNA polymerase I, partial [Bacteroides sp.]|nr:DNA polymerase I [Bacteroides sp.]